MLNPQLLTEYTQLLFDDPATARQAAEVVTALWQARSARLSDIARSMPGSEEAAVKRLQRFLEHSDPAAALWRLSDASAPFVIADPTEIARPQAKRTAYVGRLKDGKTRGFNVLVLAAPQRGRAMPFGFITYSSATIEQEGISRNQEHARAVDDVMALVGERPLIFDREFSYEGFFAHLAAARGRFVIRLALRSHPPTLLDAHSGERVSLEIAPGERRCYRDVLYRGTVRVHVVGRWARGQREPLWVVTNLARPLEALTLYEARMKIEQTFRDAKSLLGLSRVMSQSRTRMEQVVALVLLSEALGLWLGEHLRDERFGPSEAAEHDPRRRKWHHYAGLFVWLVHGLRLSASAARHFLHRLFPHFTQLLQPIVLTHLPT